MDSLFNEHAQDLGNLAKALQLVQLTAKVGAPKEVIAPMLDLAMGGTLSKKHKAFLLGSVIPHKSPWIESIPKWMVEGITADRLAVVINEIKTDTITSRVGCLEIATVMYPRVMDAPMPYAAGKVYQWATAHASALHYDKEVDAIYRDLHLRKVPDEDVTQEGGEFYQDYQEICREIRRKVVNSGLDRVREIKKANKNRKSKSTQPRKNVKLDSNTKPAKGTQLDLF